MTNEYIHNNKKIFILGATFITNNMGVCALTAGTIRILKRTWPEADISILDYGDAPTLFECDVDGEIVRVPLVNMRFSKKLYLRNHVLFLILLALAGSLLPVFLERRLYHRNPWLREISSADLLCAISGGDSFSDIYGWVRFLYVTLPQMLVILLGKPLIQLPQTYGPFTGWIPKTVAAWILRKSNRICSRDYRGIEELKTILGDAEISRKARFSYDVGFALMPTTPKTLDLAGLETRLDNRSSTLFGFNVSGLLYMGGYNRSNMFGLGLDYKAFVSRVIEHVIVEKGGIVLLTPHVFGPLSHAESDSTVSAAVYEHYNKIFPGKIFLARGNYNQSEIKWIIGKCDMFMGARMHACIAAISQEVPTIPVAYSKKFEGVMETVGMSDMVLDARSADIENAIRLVDRLFRERETIRMQLTENMPKVRDNVFSLFRDIKVAT